MKRLVITRVSKGFDTTYTIARGENVVRISLDGRRAVVSEAKAGSPVEAYTCSAEAAAQALHTFQEMSLAQFGSLHR